MATLALSSFTVCAQNATSKQSQSMATEQLSEYAGLELKIISNVKGDVIPASVPKYKSSQTIQEYKQELRLWAKNHKSLLTEEFLEKLNSKSE